MLVVAGAGTGKTSVLIHRVCPPRRARAREAGRSARPHLHRGAAGEMRDRVRAHVGKPIHSATFHDYCLDLLKRAGKDFGVLDEKDLWIYLRKRIHELHLEHYVRAANVGQFLNDLLGFLSRCHDELVTPEKYAEYVVRLERGELPVPRVAKSKDQLSDAEVIARCQEIARVFATTERWLREENLGTFGHMITRAHEMLTSDENLLATERARDSLYSGRRISGCQLRADQNPGGAGGRRGASSRSAIRIRPSTAFAGHPARPFICSAGIFRRPSWSCWARTGARPLRFCSALLPWSIRTLRCLRRATLSPTGDSFAVGARGGSGRKEERCHLPRGSDFFCRQGCGSAGRGQHHRGDAAPFALRVEGLSASSTVRTDTGTRSCNNWPSGKFLSPSRTWM
jgi:hypothetical protein